MVQHSLGGNTAVRRDHNWRFLHELHFTEIISSANFLYCMGMLLEYASFLWLRRKLPHLDRPYQVPMRLPGLIIVCLISSGFLIFTMAVATNIVFLISGLVALFGVGLYFLMKLCKDKKWFQFSNEVKDRAWTRLTAYINAYIRTWSLFSCVYWLCLSLSEISRFRNFKYENKKNIFCKSITSLLLLLCSLFIVLYMMFLNIWKTIIFRYY